MALPRSRTKTDWRAMTAKHQRVYCTASAAEGRDMRVFAVMWPDCGRPYSALAPDVAAAVRQSLCRAGVTKAERERILAGGAVDTLECRPCRVPEAMSADGETRAKFLPEPIAEKLAAEPCSAVETFAATPDATLMALCRAVWPGAKAKARVRAVNERARRSMASATPIQAVYALILALLEPGFAMSPEQRSEAVSAPTGTTAAGEGRSVAPAGALAP